MRPTALPSLLLLALASALPLTAASSEAEGKQQQKSLAPADDEADEAAFTPAQLARGRERLAQLYEESLDADRDGRVTQPELANWLARVATEEADRVADDSWRAFNLSEGDGGNASLDWDTYAARRAANSAAAAAAAADTGEAAQDEEGTAMARLQAEVRRAIDEASREIGLDKAGIKVGVPQVPQMPQATKKTTMEESSEAEAGRQLALDLARDRRRWEAADADADGRLSRREFRDFAAADAGSASSAPRMRPVVAAEVLERLDTDGDGRVSEAEFLKEGPAAEAEAEAEVAKEEAKNFREVWDSDRSGYLDQGEMERMLDYLDSPDTMAKEEALAREKEATDLLTAADKDGDGSLSKSEVLASLPEFAASAVTNYGDSVGIHDEL